MTRKRHGQVRQSQVLTTYGPGALIDLPKHSAIVGGLEFWPKPGDLTEILEPRLSRKIQAMTGVKAPKLYAPPPDVSDPREAATGVTVWRFPEWFVVQEKSSGEREKGRRLVHRRALDDRGRFDGRDVVATRFVRACNRGHVDDLNWYAFVHGSEGSDCKRPLWLVERGTGGDLGDLVVRCECGKQRGMNEAAIIGDNPPIGVCQGRRPWLGRRADETCGVPARLLIRTASNAYFSQGVSVLSLPDKGSAVDTVVKDLWEDLQIVESAAELGLLKRKPKIAARLAGLADDDVYAAIDRIKNGKVDERPVKLVELDALLSAPEGFGEDVPIDPDFHARRLPARVWRRPSTPESLEAVVQMHRMREVIALIGFTRFEAAMPDIQGEYDPELQRASIAVEPAWFPAVENRGEGVFIQLRAEAVAAWLARPAVKARIDSLIAGHEKWKALRKNARPFPGGPYVLLHTLSHLLIQSFAMRCGYPASSVRERIYADDAGKRYGILLYTGTPDAEGTLGGLVQQARYVQDHLAQALRAGALCSHDPICSQHAPGESLEGRWLHGASCHGCTLIAETSCEMRNDHLDRALLVPVLGCADAAFFPARA
jgi:hypothetical protein